MRKFLALTLCVLLCVIVFAGCSENGGLIGDIGKEATYDQAVQLLQEGNLQEAYDIFLTIKDYRDVPEYLDRFVYRSETYKISSSRTSAIQYTYDEYGRIVKTEESDSGNFASFPLTWIYEYNDQGFVKKAIRKLEDGSEITYLYEYDKNGNITKVINPSGTTAEFAYDKKGNTVEEIYRGTQGELLKHGTYTYNNHGDVLTSHVLDCELDQEYSFTYEYEYDKKGNKIKLVRDEYSEEWEYDEQGRIVRDCWEYENGARELHTYRYDQYGNVSEEYRESRYGDAGTFVYTREYDEHGNILTEKIVYNDKGATNKTYSEYKLYYNPYGVCEIPDYNMGTP